MSAVPQAEMNLNDSITRCEICQMDLRRKPSELAFVNSTKDPEELYVWDIYISIMAHVVYQIETIGKGTFKIGLAIREERKKLVQRCQKITKMQGDYAAIMVSIHAARHQGPIIGKNSDAMVPCDQNIPELLCEICLRVLSDKRHVKLECNHNFHRTCLLTIYESDAEKFLACPNCEVVLKFERVCDDMGDGLPPKIVGLTEQPTEALFSQNVTLSIDIDKVFTETADWLLEISLQLEAARKLEGKCDEYIQDIIDERNKLLQRCQSLTKMQDAIVKNRHAQEFTVDRKLLDVAFQRTNAVDNSEPHCGICFEVLSSKRSSTLTPCGHKYHWTCVAEWFDTNNKENKIFTCCYCRAEAVKVIGEDGKQIIRIYPFELFKMEELLQNRRRHSNEFLKVNRMATTSMTRACHKARRLALREGRSVEYVTDIEGEIMKIRNRANALHAYFFKVFELEELERATTKGASEPSLESEINAPTNPAAQSHAAQTTALLVDSHTTDGEVDSASGAVIEEDNAAVSATITGDNTASVASSGGDNAATLATIGEDIAALSAALEVATANINEGSMTTPAEIEYHSMESTASVEEDITVNNYAENNVSTAWIHGAHVQSAVSAIGEDNTASEARNDNDAAAVPTTIEEDNESSGVLAPNEGNNTAIDRGARNPDSANNISHNSSSSLNRRRPADGVAPISAKKGRN